MIELPVALFGIPLKGINNPLLISFVRFDTEVILNKNGLPSDFFKLFEEATGFKCDIHLDLKGNIPYSSKYVYLSEIYFRRAIELCELPIKENELWDILYMIDDSMFNSELIRGLRTAMRLGSSILYRDTEEPITVSLPILNARFLFSFPINFNFNYVDNSLIHLLGILPIEFVETKDFTLFQVENGLWYSVYGIPIPNVKGWKLIWDLNYVAGIEIRGADHFNNQ